MNVHERPLNVHERPVNGAAILPANLWEDVMITVRFTCNGCNLNNKKVEIRYRHANEPVTQWVEHVTLMISRCHATVSPRCRSRKMSNIMIPVNADKSIGIGFEPSTSPGGQTAGEPPAQIN